MLKQLTNLNVLTFVSATFLGGNVLTKFLFAYVRDLGYSYVFIFFASSQLERCLFYHIILKISPHSTIIENYFIFTYKPTVLPLSSDFPNLFYMSSIISAIQSSSLLTTFDLVCFITEQNPFGDTSDYTLRTLEFLLKDLMWFEKVLRFNRCMHIH